jgi:UDP:flavonoid glycosyltransferase YjiC (YdhE family)
MTHQKHILFGVLNWGLGHATRSIPLIKSLEKKGFAVTIASDGLALKVLKNTFPELNFLVLADLKISYGKTRNQSISIVMQLLDLQRWYKAERKIVRDFLKKNIVDEIISDNRPTVKSNNIPSYYITHQLEVKSGILTAFSTLGHKFLFKGYTEIWVPDVASTPNLSGDLSHKSTHKNIKFIGPQSDLIQRASTAKAEFDAALILSGPEPQRTLLESAAINQLAKSDLKILILRGTTNPLETKLPKSWQCINLGSRAHVQQAFEISRVIIARCGYSTLMDLYSFNKAAILIPTPGQPEQEYLASMPLHQHNFSIHRQNSLNLISGLKQAEKKFERFQNPLKKI